MTPVGLWARAVRITAETSLKSIWLGICAPSLSILAGMASRRKLDNKGNRGNQHGSSIMTLALGMQRWLKARSMMSRLLDKSMVSAVMPVVVWSHWRINAISWGWSP